MNDKMKKILEEINRNRKKFRVDHFDIIISEYLNRENFDETALQKFLKDINLLGDDEISTLDLAKITADIKKSKNPYA